MGIINTTRRYYDYYNGYLFRGHAVSGKHADGGQLSERPLGRPELGQLDLVQHLVHLANRGWRPNLERREQCRLVGRFGPRVLGAAHFPDRLVRHRLRRGQRFHRFHLRHVVIAKHSKTTHYSV